ncbi:uncharacterized protein BXIN_0011 [Babesia sp. Xinjiang]|uniref:uncharacterized protein n=1 Tax=Babesia sp. Xinjiang TaxID=462227 RepID=UPI000A2506C0|nr:uncharacterized protein BXIN_0011 [Babesia sp. Xinjiang]ORM39630.1 hypothetical protein BXIN_0011 [Babesia sp. Xinjiang]
MLETSPTIELRPTDPSSGTDATAEGSGTPTPVPAQINAANKDETKSVSLPHNAHAEVSTSGTSRETKIYDHVINNSPRNTILASPHDEPTENGSSARRTFSIGNDSSSSDPGNYDKETRLAKIREVKLKSAQRHSIGSSRGTFRRGSSVDQFSDIHQTTASASSRSNNFTVPKIKSVGLGISPEEAFKLLSESNQSSSSSTKADTAYGRDGPSSTSTFSGPPQHMIRHGVRERAKLDAELLTFLRKQTIHSLKLPRNLSTDNVTHSCNCREMALTDQSDNSNTSRTNGSVSSTLRPIRSANRQPPDYAAHFVEDSESLSQLRALFNGTVKIQSNEGDSTSISIDYSIHDGEYGLQPLSPILEWLPEEPSQPESQQEQDDDDVTTLFKDCNTSGLLDEYGAPYFASDNPDGKGDINAKVRLLRRVHESLYTTSDVASLGTIEKFMLELLQPESDFGTLSAYGRLLAYINLSALRRHMLQLSALYRHPEMEVIRQVMRCNEEGALKKVLNVSESAANGQLNDKASTAAISELMARLDRGYSHANDKETHDNSADGNVSNKPGTPAGGFKSIKSNRQLLAMLDNLSALYHPGGEPHFPRYVCGMVDRKNVISDETLSIPFDKGERRHIHVQFERLEKSCRTPWPTSTGIPHTVTEGLRLQVLPTKHQTVMYWALGTVTSVSSGVLMVSIEAHGTKETGRTASSDRMYMMRNFVPPNVPLTRLEKAHWRVLPREFDIERDVYVGSCLSVYDETVGGYVDRVVTNILFGDGDGSSIAPVKPPNEETIFEDSILPVVDTATTKVSSGPKDHSGSATLHIEPVDNRMSVAPAMSNADIIDGIFTEIKGITCAEPGKHVFFADAGHEPKLTSQNFEDTDVSTQPSGGSADTVNIECPPKIILDRYMASCTDMKCDESTNASYNDVSLPSTQDATTPILSLPTCHCNGHTLRVFEGRSVMTSGLVPKKVVLTSLYDRGDVTLDVDTLRGYKLNYDLQAHFDCVSETHSGTNNNLTGQFQHCVWVVPRYLPFTNIHPDALSMVKIGSNWFFEPERCLVIFPYNRSVDFLQEVPRLVSFLHPELNFAALCAGIWSVRASDRNFGESHQVTSESTDPHASRTEAASLTRSQKAATRELTVNDIVAEACHGVMRCPISVIRRLLGCISVISLWMILEDVDIDNLETSHPTLLIRIPEKPRCTKCGGAVYARDGVMKSLPAERPVLLTSDTVDTESIGASIGDTADSGKPVTKGKKAGKGLTADFCSDADSLMDTCMNRLADAGMNIQGIRHDGQLNKVIGVSSTVTGELDPNCIGNSGPVVRTRETPIFSDLESTEEVINLLQCLSTSRWRLTREFTAAHGVNDDVASAVVRAQHQPLPTAMGRIYNEKRDFINKLAHFLSNTRRAKDTRIESELYREAYSSCSEQFDPRSIEAVLLRGWGAFLMGPSSRGSHHGQVPASTASCSQDTQQPDTSVNGVGEGGARHKSSSTSYNGEFSLMNAMLRDERDLFAAHIFSECPDDDTHGSSGATGAHKRKSRDDKRSRNSRAESPNDNRGGTPDQRRSTTEQGKKPRRSGKSLLARLAENEYCEFKDKEVRFKFVSVVKWDEDLEPSALVTSAQ